MAAAGGATAAAAAAINVSSSYRVKFRRREFLELVEVAKPKIIYHRRRMHFFAYDGFVIDPGTSKAPTTQIHYYHE
jgi:hypothetical protein